MEIRKTSWVPERTDIAAGSSKTSPMRININNGLDLVTISCVKIKSERNFFNGFRNQSLNSFPITTFGLLKGSSSDYVNLNVIKPITGDYFTKLICTSSEKVGWIKMD